MRVEPLDFEIHWRRAHPFSWGRNGRVNPFICHFGTSSHTTTETKNNDPWAPQQPYLQAGFGAAQGLLDNPLPQQQNPVAPFNSTESSSLQAIINQAMGGGSPVTGAGVNFGADLLNGSYFNNPANSYFSSLAGSNPATGAPGSDALSKFANGGYFSNGYSDDVAKNVMAQVIPQVSTAFNRGNSLNNPQAARSAAEGVTSALAPLEYSNYQTQEQLAQNAASTLGSQSLAGKGLQLQGAQGLSSSFQDTLAKMVQGLALAPSTQNLSYGDMSQAFNAGQAQQTQAQNEAGGQAASYNFSQMAPYQQLQAYMQAISGNYGGTSTDTKPYYTNDTANTFGTASGIASLAMAIPFL